MIKINLTPAKLLFIAFLALLSTSHPAMGQQGAPPLQSQHGIRFSVLVPNLHYYYESSLGQSSLLEFAAGIHYGFLYRQFHTDPLGGDIIMRNTKETTQLLSPYLSVGYKYYYDREKRHAKGKFLEENSGNYWGLRTYQGLEGWKNQQQKVNGKVEREKEFSSRYRGRVVAFWGIRRSMGRGFSLDVELGPELSFGKRQVTQILPWGNLGFRKSF